MPSPSAAATTSTSVLEQWRAEGGERLTFSEVGWSGAAVALVLHASLHFFSVVLIGLERFLVVFGPPERFAFGLTEGSNPLATWLLLLFAVGTWGALIGVGVLAAVHQLSSLFRRA